MTKAKTILEFTNCLWLTPKEYSEKYSIPIRTLYWEIQKGKRDFSVLKGKKVIIDEHINLTNLKTIL